MTNVRRSTVRAAILACGFVLFLSADMLAQSCPAPAQPKIQFVGQTSGCTQDFGPCALGEQLLFSAVPAAGGTYPACMAYFWLFGDGADSNQPTPLHAYATAGEFFVNVQVFSENGDAFAGAPLNVVSATVTPVITSFTTSALRVIKGKPIVLRWVVRDATRIKIDPINVTLDPSVGMYKFVPSETRTYKLSAFGIAAIAESKTPITVLVGPRRRPVRH
jgi:PKD domain-containing protein